LHPEYLTSVFVAKALLGWSLKSKAGASYSVRLEPQVNILATGCFRNPPVMKNRTLPTRSGKPTHKKERCDVALLQRAQGLREITRAIVEIKNFKSAPGYLKRDLGRLKRIMELSDSKGESDSRATNTSLVCAVSFFLFDKRSVGRDQGTRFLERARKRYGKLLPDYSSQQIRATLKMDTIGLPPDDPNEEFRHVVGGMICLERQDDDA
jgi:hypothetical protein